MKRLSSFKEFLNESDDEISYSFSELSPKAQENALESMRDINIDSDWWHEDLIENFKAEMEEEYGFSVDDVQYTGFWSQGDGASFTGRSEDSDLFMRKGLGITTSTELIDMGEESKSSDDEDLYGLMGDLRDVGFDARTRYKPDDFYFSVVRNSSRYSHENTISGEVEVDEIDIEDDDERDFNGLVDELAENTTEWARDKSRELYSRLEKEYEWLSSAEAVQETIESLDYKFDEDGNPIDV